MPAHFEMGRAPVTSLWCHFWEKTLFA